MKRTVSALFVAALLLVTAGSLEAQVRFGGQANLADDTDFGIGPRIALDLQELGPRFQFVGTWDIYFPDEENLDFWELNGNLMYRFDLQQTNAVVPYGGAGLNVARTTIETPGDDIDSTDLGVNFVGGAEFPLQSFTPFLEFRITAEGSEQLYLTGGVLIP